MRTDVSNIIEIAKDIQKSQKKEQKQVEKQQNFELSQRARNVARNKAEVEAEYISKKLHDLHCECVNQGIAAYEPERYKNIIVSDRTGTRKIKRKEPNLQ